MTTEETKPAAVATPALAIGETKPVVSSGPSASDASQPATDPPKESKNLKESIVSVVNKVLPAKKNVDKADKTESPVADDTPVVDETESPSIGSKLKSMVSLKKTIKPVPSEGEDEIPATEEPAAEGVQAQDEEPAPKVTMLQRLKSKRLSKTSTPPAENEETGAKDIAPEPSATEQPAVRPSMLRRLSSKIIPAKPTPKADDAEVRAPAETDAKVAVEPEALPVSENEATESKSNFVASFGKLFRSKSKASAEDAPAEPVAEAAPIAGAAEPIAESSAQAAAAAAPKPAKRTSFIHKVIPRRVPPPVADGEVASSQSSASSASSAPSDGPSIFQRILTLVRRKSSASATEPSATATPVVEAPPAEPVSALSDTDSTPVEKKRLSVMIQQVTRKLTVRKQESPKVEQVPAAVEVQPRPTVELTADRLAAVTNLLPEHVHVRPTANLTADDLAAASKFPPTPEVHERPTTELTADELAAATTLLPEHVHVRPTAKLTADELAAASTLLPLKPTLVQKLKSKLLPKAAAAPVVVA